MDKKDKAKEELAEEIGFLQKRIMELEKADGECKNDEQENKDSRALLQRIIDLLPIRIFWKDKDLRYLGCNAIFAKDAGKDRPEDLIGKDDFQMGWKDQAEIYRADDQEVMKSGKAKLNFDEPQTTPKGDKIWLRTSKVHLIDSQGNEVGVLGTYEDITEYKQSAEKLKDKVVELEKMNKIMLNRELRMVELKKEISNLRKDLEKPMQSGDDNQEA